MHDAIIVGAGVAGPTLAVALARQNRKVLLIERDWTPPDRIVGELLQPGGVSALKTLGMQQALDDIDAVQVPGYEVIYDGKHVHIPYPVVGTQQVTGQSFHHPRFVDKLRTLAKNHKGVTCLQATVTDVIQESVDSRVTGVKYTTTPDGETHQQLAPLTFICDGTFSKFRRTLLKSRPAVKSHFAGLVLKDVPLPEKNYGHVIIGPRHAPILVYQIGTHESRVLCDIRGAVPSASTGALKQHLADHVQPFLPPALQPCFRDALNDPSQRIRVMPNQYLRAPYNAIDGVVVIGDALNIRHPLTGGGMTVALNDVCILQQLLAPENVASFSDHALVRAQIHKFHKQRRPMGSVINVLAQALYSLFAAGRDSRDLRVLQRGCYWYFRRGGECVTGPISLLSGVLPRPAILFYHFFSVALYAIYINVWSNGLVALLQSFSIFWTSWVVLVAYLWSELVA